MANECVDDGRGDSPRLRTTYSLPRPSHETLAKIKDNGHLMDKILFVELTDISSKPDIDFISDRYIFESLKTMHFKDLESRSLPKRGENFIVSIHHGSRHTYKCINCHTDKTKTIDGYDAVVYAKWLGRAPYLSN